MIQGFLFDRIEAEPAGAAIGGQNHPVVNIPAHKTKSPLTFTQGAQAPTKMALQTAIIGFIPITPKVRHNIQDIFLIPSGDMIPMETTILRASSTVQPQSNVWEGLTIKTIPVNGCGEEGTNILNSSSPF